MKSTTTRPPESDTTVLATVIRVKNLETAAQWYSGVLGLREEFRDPEFRIIQYRSLCGCPLAIWEIREHETYTPALPTGAYVALRTDNVEHKRQELQQKGIKVGEIISKSGVKMFWLYDPDGSAFAMIQFLLE